MVRSLTIARSAKQQQGSPMPVQLYAAGKHATFQFADKRASSVDQRQVQAIVHKSPQVTQALQMQAMATQFAQRQPQVIQKRANSTGLPDQLKSGVESLSGISMNDVKVHYNSSKPATLQAHAYAQGTQIHIAPGQEKHLPHEAWHVVQQKQGRVKATMQLKGVGINDDRSLEREANVMGTKALGKGALQLMRDPDLWGIVQRHGTMDLRGLEAGRSNAHETGGMQFKAFAPKRLRVRSLRENNWNNPAQLASFADIRKGVGDFLKNPKVNAALLIAEGSLSVIAGGLMIATLTPPGLLAGIPMVATGVMKIGRGILGFIKIKAQSSNSEKWVKRITLAENVLRGLESISQGITAKALMPGPLGIVLMVQAGIKLLRSFAQFVESHSDEGSRVKKVASGIGAALHYLEVAAGFAAAGLGFAHTGAGAFGPFATTGISASKTMRASGKAVKTSEMRVTEGEHAPLIN